MKPLTRTLFAVSLAAALVVVCFERNTLSNARSENQRLRGASAERERLVQENAEINQMRAEVQALEKLREETRELHKLRNDVRQLREQKSEWDRVRAENRKLQAGAEPGGQPAARASEPASAIAREMLSDAGFGSPEATVRTFFWALCEGNVEKVRSCFTADTPNELLPGERTPIAGFKELSVVAKKVVSPDDVMLGIRFSEQGEAPQELALAFKRVAGEWKLNMAGAR